MNLFYDDGGRSKYFDTLDVQDCVTRSIAIATNLNYLDIHHEISKRVSKNKNADMPVSNKIMKSYLLELGYKYIKPIKNGKLLRLDDLPKNKVLMVKIAKHLTVLNHGSILDTWDCSKDGKACVYGYFKYEKT